MRERLIPLLRGWPLQHLLHNDPSDLGGAFQSLCVAPARAAVPGTRLRQGGWIAAGQTLEFAWHHFIASTAGRCL